MCERFRQLSLTRVGPVHQEASVTSLNHYQLTLRNHHSPRKEEAFLPCDETAPRADANFDADEDGSIASRCHHDVIIVNHLIPTQMPRAY